MFQRKNLKLVKIIFMSTDRQNKLMFVHFVQRKKKKKNHKRNIYNFISTAYEIC